MGKIIFEYAGGKLEFEKDDKVILEILAANREQLIPEQSITAEKLEASIIKRMEEQANCMIGDCQFRGRFRCGKDCGRYKSPDHTCDITKVGKPCEGGKTEDVKNWEKKYAGGRA